MGSKRVLLAILVAGILSAGVAHAQFEMKWAVEGYYRTRAVTLTNLAPEPRWEVTPPGLGVTVVMPEIRNQSYITQRLRLSPSLSYGSIAKLYMEVNAFDDVLFGDNNGISTAPLFAVNGSNQSYLGGEESSSVEFSRAWIEFQVPVGLLRVGRMPSHWGTGILANGGGSGNWDPTAPPGEPRKVPDYFFDDDFGDNHFGSTNDRILFATRPLTILKTILGKANTASNVVFAYAFDKLSEAPFLINEEDREARPFGQTGFLSRGTDEDDANEHVLVLAYANPDWDRVRYTDELKLGTYWVFRTQAEGFTEPSSFEPDTPTDCATDPDCVTEDEGSFVWIGDLWYRIRYGSWYSEAEYVHIGGETTGGVPFPKANGRKEADIDGGVFRLGFLSDTLDGVLELGFASGDDNMGDLVFKQRAWHADYNVGLILFEEIIRERSARAFGPLYMSESSPDGAKGFFSNGGVLNAKYINPKIRVRPNLHFGGKLDALGAVLNQFEFVGSALFSWVDEWSEKPNVFVCPDVDGVDVSPADCTASKYLGTELDLAVKSRFAGDHIEFTLETGYLFFGEVLKTKSDGTGTLLENPPGGAFSLQARVAYVF